MIVLIRVENFYKIQHPFMIKNKKQKTNTSWDLEIEGLIKCIYQKKSMRNILMEKMLKFLSSSKRRMLLSQLISNRTFSKKTAYFKEQENCLRGTGFSFLKRKRMELNWVRLCKSDTEWGTWPSPGEVGEGTTVWLGKILPPRNQDQRTRFPPTMLKQPLWRKLQRIIKSPE